MVLNGQLQRGSMRDGGGWADGAVELVGWRVVGSSEGDKGG